ncbi:MAG: hypothetical protein QG646_2199 [Euryarchaeota archaeon]|nr:hypothetical protein [Euryarchaeota archaeon]
MLTVLKQMNEIQEKAEDRCKLALEADLKHLDSFKYKTYEKSILYCTKNK